MVLEDAADPLERPRGEYIHGGVAGQVFSFPPLLQRGKIVVPSSSCRQRCKFYIFELEYEYTVRVATNYMTNACDSYNRPIYNP